jgi:hypothetical protein
LKANNLNIREKQLEEIKPVVNSPYWAKIQDLIDSLISEKRDSLERVSTFEEVLRLRGNIEAFKEIKNLDEAIKLFDENTNPQSRGRESQLYMTKP